MPVPMATKIFTSDLRVGMFVADLDRPWVDTPFLLQGFLIEDEEQLAALRAHCEYVIVDRARSVGDEYEAPGVRTSTLPPIPNVRVASAAAAATSGAKPGSVKAGATAADPGVAALGNAARPSAGKPGRPVKLEDIARGGGAGEGEPGMLGRMFRGLWGRKEKLKG